MLEEIIKVIMLVMLLCAFKFFFGPIGGYAAKLHIVPTMVGTVAGMMTSVVAFTYFGDWLRTRWIDRWFKRKHQSPMRKRKLLNLWHKYGMIGVAVLTPVLFTPIGGTLIAVSFRAPKEKILFFMFISAVLWSLLVTSAVYFFGKEILPDYAR